MRKFDQNDWDYFAGCETENPLIGECSICHCGETIDAQVVVDGKDMQIFGATKDGNSMEFYIEFPSFFFCKNAAEWLIENKILTVAMLESMGFDANL